MPKVRQCKCNSITKFDIIKIEVIKIEVIKIKVIEIEVIKIEVGTFFLVEVKIHNFVQ